MRKALRLLVYGFGPYQHFKTNVTQEIVRRFPRRPGLKKVVFRVRFHRKQFIDALTRHRPDVVLGLGQCSTGPRLRVETRALNARLRGKAGGLQPIIPGGPRALASGLALRLGSRATPSRNAGRYVCNYSMYVMLDWLRRHRPEARFGFVHVPCDYRAEAVVRILAGAVDRIAPSRPDRSPLPMRAARGRRRKAARPARPVVKRRRSCSN